MRKAGPDKPFFIIAILLGVLFLFLAFTHKTDLSQCTADINCAEPIEEVRGTELLWESLSRQFVTSILPY